MRVALVTGGTRGIGAAISIKLKESGYKVAAIYAGNDEVATKFSKENKIAVFQWSIANYEECVAGIKSVEDELGAIDILVNNAGGGGFGNLDQLTFEEWRNIMALNMDSVFLGCKTAAPLLQADGGGSIINISSTNANRAWAMFSGYCSAKAGMTMFSKCVAQHFLETNANVRCNTVHPGPIETPNFRRLTAAEGAEQLLADWQKNNPFTEIGSVEDIGEVVAFLASDAARYVNASEFVAAGGTLL